MKNLNEEIKKRNMQVYLKTCEMIKDLKKQNEYFKQRIKVENDLLTKYHSQIDFNNRLLPVLEEIKAHYHKGTFEGLDNIEA